MPAPSGAAGAPELLAALEARYGLRNVHAQWLRLHAGFTAERLRGAICNGDLPALTRGGLPWRVADAHDAPLAVPLLVQLEDVINISAADPRAARATTLQAVLCDGAQEFVAVELRPLRGLLAMHTTPGTKLVLAAHTRVRRGRVLLAPHCVRLLGGPPHNLWAAAYDQRKRDALHSAGLPVPGASTFDVIAAQGPDAARNALPTMGGIAEVAIPNHPSQSGPDDDDDDAFWLQAAAVADASIAQTRESQVAPLPPHAVSAPASISAPAAVPATPVPPRASERAAHAAHVRPPPSRVNVASPPVASRAASAHAMPAAPFAADVIMDSEDEADRVGQNATVRAEKCPLHYISDKRSKRNGDSDSVFRAFALRSRMQGDERRFVLRMTVDDGTGICEMELDKQVTDQVTGGLSSRQILEISKNEEEGKAFKTKVRSTVRAMHGFVQAAHLWESSLVTAVAPAPPGGMNDFLRKYAANVEFRWQEFRNSP